MRLHTIVLVLPFLLFAKAKAQGGDAASLMLFGRLADSRAEAMGGEGAAMPGDVRTMVQSPASLIEMNGLDLYYRYASPYAYFTKSTFEHLALAYRISDRLAFGFRYDNDRLNVNKLTFGDFIDPRRGYIYPIFATPGFYDHRQTLAGTLAFKVYGGLSIGASVENIDLTFRNEPLTYGSFGIREVVKLKPNGLWRHAITGSLNCTNFTSAMEELPYAGEIATYQLPVITRTAAAYTVELHKGWLADTLPSLRFIAHVQYDDDLTAKKNSAIRFGGELQVCGILALRGGWYRQTMPSTPQYDQYRGGFTYGFGLELPLQAITTGRVPLSASIDFTSSPQAAVIGKSEGMKVSYGRAYENFQSIGIRLNLGVGQLCKKRSKTE